MLLLPTALLLLVNGILVTAFPSPYQPLRHVVGWMKQQQPVRESSISNKDAKTTSHRDAAPNSVGMLFTTAEDEEVSHVWLPLGKRLYTRDSPELPLHPITARITIMIRSTPEIATLEHLNRVFCKVYPRYNRTEDVPNPDALAIQLWRADELVRLAEVSQRSWREVDSYECT